MASDTVWLAAIAATTSMGMLITKRMLDRMDKKADARALIVREEATAKARATLEKLEQIHKEFNGMKDALVKQAGELGEEKGHKAGIAEKQIEIDQIHKDADPNAEKT